MAKKVTIRYRTLYTGFFLVITMMALKTASAERNQKMSCCVVMPNRFSYS
jgi:hypothetical protein